MNKVSMLEFRNNAEAVIRRVRQGQCMVLTYRGKPVMRMTPVAERPTSSRDPFYALDRLAADGGNSLDNREIDEILYGEADLC